jgi:hypothetical protein
MTAVICGGDICLTVVRIALLNLVLTMMEASRNLLQISQSQHWLSGMDVTDVPLEGFAPTLFTVCVDDVPEPQFDAGSYSLVLPKGFAGLDDDQVIRGI